jgi:hypothetical protein
MMRTGLAVGYSAFFSGFVGAAVFVASQICVVRANASFAGRWEGKMNDLPGIDLKIEEREGKISGKAIFLLSGTQRPEWSVADERRISRAAASASRGG